MLNGCSNLIPVDADYKKTWLETTPKDQQPSIPGKEFALVSPTFSTRTGKNERWIDSIVYRKRSQAYLELDKPKGKESLRRERTKQQKESTKVSVEWWLPIPGAPFCPRLVTIDDFHLLFFFFFFFTFYQILRLPCNNWSQSMSPPVSIFLFGPDR